MQSNKAELPGKPQAGVAGVVSPNPRDAELALQFLSESGVSARAYPTLPDATSVLDEMDCLLIVEEALLAEELSAFQEALNALPAWKDLPLIIVSTNVAAMVEITATNLPNSGNVTLLERPLNPHTLVSAVQVALRATARQREVGELLHEREQAVKLRDEFLAMLAHELRNPLAPMRNALYVMRTKKLGDPLLERSAEIVERQVSHLARMVDDLMDVARLERGKVVLKRQRLDLNGVVASAVESCLPAAQQKGHQVNVRFAMNALPIEGDPVRLEQIICNLLNNAAKFSPRPEKIVVETSTQGAFAEVRITDKGIGFEPGVAQTLFDPFLQVNPTLERTAGGLGMGLTIVKHLTELHGGTVQAKSEGPGTGACFTV